MKAAVEARANALAVGFHALTSRQDDLAKDLQTALQPLQQQPQHDGDDVARLVGCRAGVSASEASNSDDLAAQIHEALSDLRSAYSAEIGSLKAEVEARTDALRARQDSLTKDLQTVSQQQQQNDDDSRLARIATGKAGVTACDIGSSRQPRGARGCLVAVPRHG